MKFNQSLGVAISSDDGVLPLNLTEAKAHLRIGKNDNDEDDSLEAYIRSAVRYIEKETNRAVLSKTYIETFGPICGRCIPLGRYCATDISKVEYLNSDDEWTQIDSTQFYLSAAGVAPSLIKLKAAYDWPSDFIANGEERLRITYEAGAASVAEIDPEIKQAIKFLTAHYFENRVPITEASSSEVPLTIQASIDLLKIYWL